MTTTTYCLINRSNDSYKEVECEHIVFKYKEKTATAIGGRIHGKVFYDVGVVCTRSAIRLFNKQMIKESW